MVTVSFLASFLLILFYITLLCWFFNQNRHLFFIVFNTILLRNILCYCYYSGIIDLRGDNYTFHLRAINHLYDGYYPAIGSGLYPLILAYEDDDLISVMDGFFFKKFPNDSSDIDMNEVIKFASQVSDNFNEIKSYMENIKENMSLETKYKDVIGFIKTI